MPEATEERVLAFDFGTRRIGVAVGVCAGSVTTARALTVIAGEANAPRFAAIAALIRDWQPTRLLVGAPCHLDGTAHAMTARCARFAAQLRGRFGLPVDAVDERLSSAEAEAALAHLAPARRQYKLDAEAARIILERWLDAQRAPTSAASG